GRRPLVPEGWAHLAPALCRPRERSSRCGEQRASHKHSLRCRRQGIVADNRRDRLAGSKGEGAACRGGHLDGIRRPATLRRGPATTAIRAASERAMPAGFGLKARDGKRGQAPPIFIYMKT